MHTDALNAPCDNLVMGLSRFEGGDLWVEWPASAPRDPRLKYETRSFDSRSTLGALLPVSKHPVLFCAKSLKHETCPFRGRRVVLVAYSLQAADQANSSDQELLKSLEFNWPRPCDLQNPNPNPPRILHGTDAAPRVVPSIAQVFSGDGSLISGFRRTGWHTLSIDCSVAPGRHKHQPLVCELSTPAAQEFALRILQDFGPSVIYIRPPCRTANRARTRPLPASHPAADKCPPLRSGDMPWGLDGLSPRQKAQVETENRLFRFSAKVLAWALERGAFVCLENPDTSLFWECLTSTPEFRRAEDSLKSFCGDLCMLGGSRPASVKFVTNLPSLGPLLRKCPGSGPQHKHAPFGFLSTTPHKCLRPEQGAQHGAFSISEVSLSGLLRILPRPPLRIRYPWAFMLPQRSSSMAGPSVVSDSFKRALFANLTKAPSEVANLRASFLEHVTALTEKLRPDEEALHRSFPLELQRVLKGKRLLLFRSLLEEYNYDDVGVWKVLRDGPTLTGTQDHPPYSERHFRPATLSTEQLERESCWRRASVTSKTSSRQDAATLTSLGEAEVAAGFVTGPYHSDAEVTKALGRSDWVATPRFVLLQGSKAKPRVIDDCKSSGLNSSFPLQSAFGCKTWTMSLQ